MMNIEIIREQSTVHGTLGHMRCGRDGPRLCTMEPPWKDNARGLSCITAGTYALVAHTSPRFGRCYLLLEVPGRSYVLFHAGNVGGDTEVGLHTHTLGCILPGLRLGWLSINGRRQRAVMASRIAFRQWMSWAAGRPLSLTISWG